MTWLLERANSEFRSFPTDGTLSDLNEEIVATLHYYPRSGHVSVCAGDE